MAEKRLYRIELLVYAWADKAEAAQDVVEEQLGPLDDHILRIQATDEVDESWADTYPYGGPEGRTCAQLLHAQEEAQHAAEEVASVDANQLPLGVEAMGIDVLASQYHRAVEQALQERDFAEEDPNGGDEAFRTEYQAERFAHAAISPVCIGCGKHPAELEEYVENPDADPDPDAYVRREEGTYNPANGHFACTICYCKMGMPSTPRGWKAP